MKKSAKSEFDRVFAEFAAKQEKIFGELDAMCYQVKKVTNPLGGAYQYRIDKITKDGLKLIFPFLSWPELVNFHGYILDHLIQQNSAIKAEVEFPLAF